MTPQTAVLVVLLGGIGLTACTSRSEGVPIPPESGANTTTAGLETAAIRETVVEFLDAYAGSGETVEPLRDLVAGRELRDWVHWLGVQNRHLPQATGELEVRGVRVLQIQGDVAAAAVDADVSFTFMAEEGEETILPRSFQGPVILTRLDGPVSWAVHDVVRDGRSMTDSITLLNPPASARGQGLVVEVVSIYRFSAGTVVNLRVRNIGGDQVRIDRERTELQVGGMSLNPIGTTRTFARPLPHNELVQGAFDFDNVELTTAPEAVVLRFHGDREPITLALPVEDFTQGA